MTNTTCAARGFRALIAAGILAGLSMPAAATPMAYNFSADVPEFSGTLFDPLESFLTNDLGLTEISGMVSWDTDDLDANGDGLLQVPGEASVMSDLDAYESTTVGMSVGIDNGTLVEIGYWDFQIGDDFFNLILVDLDSSPNWFVAHGESGVTGEASAENWSLVSKQTVPEPGSMALLAMGLLTIALVTGMRRFREFADADLRFLGG